MTSIPNRVRKLEDELEAASARPGSVTEMTDAELIEIVLDGAPEADLGTILAHFERTGTFPGSARRDH